MQATNIAIEQRGAIWPRSCGRPASSGGDGLVGRGQRRPTKPPDQGGWNIFITWSGGSHRQPDP
jgi:hypothetical protein